MIPVCGKFKCCSAARIAISILLALPVGVACAQRVAPFTPATLGEGEQSLTAQLRTPFERPSGNYDVALRCQVIVEPDGTTRLPRCLVIDRYAVFRQEAERALARAIMTPARIDGEPVRVLMNLIVGYRCAGTCPAFLFANHGRNVAEYGFSYSAPQPVLGDDTWYEGFEEKLEWAASELSLAEVGGVRFLISARINDSGRTSQQRVDGEYPGSTDRDYTAFAEDAADSLRDARYIPGFSRGEPVDMWLYEYWLDPVGAPLELLTLPVRVHILWSDLVPALDSTLTEKQIREMLAEANEYWQPAAIQWEIESIIRTQAERQLGFRRAVIDNPTAGARGGNEPYSQICPSESRLETGWTVCFVRALPRGALYFNAQGVALLGEQDVLGAEIPQFALAHALGHLMGLRDAQSCAGTFMRWFEGAEPGNLCSNQTPTDLSDSQIHRARIQGLVGRPSRGSDGGGGGAGMGMGR